MLKYEIQMVNKRLARKIFTIPIAKANNVVQPMSKQVDNNTYNMLKGDDSDEENQHFTMRDGPNEKNCLEIKTLKRL